MGALGSGRAESKSRELAMEYFQGGDGGYIGGRSCLVAKLEGKPVMENLKVVDRLMRVAGLRLRERKDNREQARFAWEAEDRQTEVEEKAEAVRIANLPEPEYDPEALIEQAFGPNPFKKKTDSEDNDEEDWELEEGDEQSSDGVESSAAQSINNGQNKAEVGKRESGNGVDSQDSKVQRPKFRRGWRRNNGTHGKHQQGSQERNRVIEVAGGVRGTRPCIRLRSGSVRGRERGRGGFPDTLE